MSADVNRGYEAAPAPVGNPLEPAVATAELRGPCDCCERPMPVTVYRDGTALCDECIVALTGGVSA